MHEITAQGRDEWGWGGGGWNERGSHAAVRMRGGWN